jgi:2-C-methyl-D-erythritol 4-phosphate cytidylyltransferase
MTVVAIVLGAGTGVRLGTTVNKSYVCVGNEPILARSARAFREHPAVDELHVVAAYDELELCRRVLEDAGVRTDGIVAGGSTRHASELAAVESIAPRIESGEVDLVVIHDAARPLVDAATIQRTIDSAREHGAAIAALPVEGTLAVVHDDLMVGRRPAEHLWRAQTPQGFAAAPLLAAFRQGVEDGFEGSDTSMSLERLGVPIRVVHGDERNMKVTYPVDLLRAQAFLEGDRE